MRQAGFYWVSQVRMSQIDIFIAEWTGRVWIVPGDESIWKDTDFKYIGPKIDPKIAPPAEMFDFGKDK